MFISIHISIFMFLYIYIRVVGELDSDNKARYKNANEKENSKAGNSNFCHTFLSKVADINTYLFIFQLVFNRCYMVLASDRRLNRVIFDISIGSGPKWSYSFVSHLSTNNSLFVAMLLVIVWAYHHISIYLKLITWIINTNLMRMRKTP